jgi:hypothetical protein
VAGFPVPASKNAKTLDRPLVLSHEDVVPQEGRRRSLGYNVVLSTEVLIT